MSAQAVVGHLAQGLAAIATVRVSRGLAGDGVLLAHSLVRPPGADKGRVRPAAGRCRLSGSCSPYRLPLRGNRSPPFLSASGGARRGLEAGVAGSINALVHPVSCGCRARPCSWSRRLRRGDYRHRFGGPRCVFHKWTPGGQSNVRGGTQDCHRTGDTKYARERRVDRLQATAWIAAQFRLREKRKGGCKHRHDNEYQCHATFAAADHDACDRKVHECQSQQQPETLHRSPRSSWRLNDGSDRVDPRISRSLGFLSRPPGSWAGRPRAPACPPAGGRCRRPRPGTPGVAASGRQWR